MIQHCILHIVISLTTQLKKPRNHLILQSAVTTDDRQQVPKKKPSLLVVNHGVMPFSCVLNYSPANISKKYGTAITNNLESPVDCTAHNRMFSDSLKDYRQFSMGFEHLTFVFVFFYFL